MSALYLYVNALLCALFAVWCTLKMKSAAHSLGYESLTKSGESEYLVMYGGLQLGLAIVFYAFASLPLLNRLGVRFSLALYLPIVVYRLSSIVLRGPVQLMTRAVAALEFTLLAAAVALYFAERAELVR